LCNRGLNPQEERGGRSKGKGGLEKSCQQSHLKEGGVEENRAIKNRGKVLGKSAGDEGGGGGDEKKKGVSTIIVVVTKGVSEKCPSRRGEKKGLEKRNVCRRKGEMRELPPVRWVRDGGKDKGTNCCI